MAEYALEAGAIGFNALNFVNDPKQMPCGPIYSIYQFDMHAASYMMMHIIMCMFELPKILIRCYNFRKSLGWINDHHAQHTQAHYIIAAYNAAHRFELEIQLSAVDTCRVGYGRV